MNYCAFKTVIWSNVSVLENNSSLWGQEPKYLTLNLTLWERSNLGKILSSMKSHFCWSFSPHKEFKEAAFKFCPLDIQDVKLKKKKVQTVWWSPVFYSSLIECPRFTSLVFMIPYSRIWHFNILTTLSWRSLSKWQKQEGHCDLPSLQYFLEIDYKTPMSKVPFCTRGKEDILIITEG